MSDNLTVDTYEEELKRKQLIEQYMQAATTGVAGATSEASADTAIKAMSQVVLAQPSVKVTGQGSTTKTRETNTTTTGTTGVPSIDEPSSAANLSANLEKLLLYLQLDNEERQTQLAEERLEAEKSELEQAQNEMADKIEDNIQAMDEAYKSSKLSSILGWVGAAIAVVLAVASVVTAGATLPAMMAVVGAVVAVGSQVLNETGAMEKINDAISEKFFQGVFGMDKTTADAAASITTGVILMAASLATGAYGTTALTGVLSSMTAKIAFYGMMTAFSAASLGAQGYSIKANYDATMSEADKTSAQGILEKLQEMMEETEEELEELISMVQDVLSNMAEIINSAMDEEKEIATNLGNMA